jgi:hypothetical protein
MKCSTCGAPVKIEGKTTLYYKNEYDDLLSKFELAMWCLENLQKDKWVYNQSLKYGDPESFESAGQILDYTLNSIKKL